MPKEIKDKYNYGKRFQNGFKILLYSRSPYKVWQDLMTVFAIEIANTTMRKISEQDEVLKAVWDKREKEYIRIMKSYNEKERRIIVQMFTLMVMELEKNPDQDFLGKIYMELEISNKNAGQFFTPYSICQLMSSITLDKKSVAKEVKEKGWITINDCACGAGATLIAAVIECKRLFKRLNFQNHILVVAQDIDATVAYMCYIQLSLLGVATIVKIGNTIVDPEIRMTKDNADCFLFSPMYMSDVWAMRRFFHGLDLCMNKIEKSEKVVDK